MPKVGMEPIRKAALIKATLEMIGEVGNLDVTVSQIAKRAGMSSSLAHHYFGSKEQIFLAAMRHTLVVYGAEVRAALAEAETSLERLHAIIKAGFGTTNFRQEVVATWLNFYVLAQTSEPAKRLLMIYQTRLQSNLIHSLRPLVGERAVCIADRISGLIDGLYLHEALGQQVPDGNAATAHVLRALELELEGAT
jgi:TetR/AcrR family transcriptional repressor of bet genes